MTAPVAVEFTAELRQIKTMADGTVNVTLNLPEYCIEHAQIMMLWIGEQVRVVAIKQESDVVKQQEQQGNAVQERRKRKSEWTPP